MGTGPGLCGLITSTSYFASYRRFNAAMQKTSNQSGGSSIRKPRTLKNRGWFLPGDMRINRDGRPRGSKPAIQEHLRPDLAPCADRLKLLIVPSKDLAWRLTKEKAPWIANLPTAGSDFHRSPDFQIVGCRFDAIRNAIVFVIRAGGFPRIAKGTPIPEFQPSFDGLRWKSR